MKDVQYMIYTQLRSFRSQSHSLPCVAIETQIYLSPCYSTEEGTAHPTRLAIIPPAPTVPTQGLSLGHRPEAHTSVGLTR